MDENKIKGFFLNAKRKDRVANAYIVSGGSAAKRRNIADYFSALMTCGNTPACMDCFSCKKAAKKAHPDIRWIVPSKSVLSIEDVRGVKQDISITPYEGEKKVYIFEIDYMRDESANAFLKILEEPPSYAVFLILSGNVNFFLPTIVSRCQNLKLNYELPSDDTGFEESVKEFVAMLDSAKKKKYFDFFKLVDVFAKKNEREDVEKWLKIIIFLYRNEYIEKFSIPECLKMDIYNAFKLLEDKENSIKAVESLLEINNRLKYNINVRLGIESLLLQISTLK